MITDRYKSMSSGVISSAWHYIDESLSKWPICVRNSSDPSCEEATKVLFFRAIFADPLMVKQIEACMKSEPLEEHLNHLRDSLQTRVRQILMKGNMQNAHSWMMAMTDTSRLDELVQEALSRSGSVPELRPLATLSPAQRYACIQNVRDKRLVTQLYAGSKTTIHFLPYLVVLVVSLNGLSALSFLVRRIMLRMISYSGWNTLPCYSSILVPVIEEVAFRGGVQQGIVEGLKHTTLVSDEESLRKIAIVISSIVFGFAHVWHYVLSPMQGCIHAITAFSAGLLLGSLYERYGIIASVTSHITINTLVSIPLFFAKGYGQETRTLLSRSLLCI